MKWVQCAHCTDGQKKPQKQAGRLGTGEWGILVCWQWGSIPGLGLPAWHLRRRLWGLPEPGVWRGISPIIQDSAFWHFVAATLSHLSLYLWEASFCLFVCLATLCSLRNLNSPTKDWTGPLQSKSRVLTTGPPRSSWEASFKCITVMIFSLNILSHHKGSVWLCFIHLFLYFILDLSLFLKEDTCSL